MIAADLIPKSAPPRTSLITWHYFEVREASEEEQKEFGCGWIYCGELPEDGQDILISDGASVWIDTYVNYDEPGIEKGELASCIAWAPLPDPPRPLSKVKHGKSV